MRVASRRVRAGWRVFGDAFERPVVRERVRQLRVLGSELGMVRDLDVQIGILVASRDRRSKRERLALAPLVDAWTAERAARHHALVVRLRSPWFTAFVADHDRLVTTAGRGRTDDRTARARDRAHARAVGRLAVVPGGLGVRARAARRGRDDAPRAADLDQVAALHARIDPRADGAAAPPSSSDASSRCRTSSATSTTSMPPRNVPGRPRPPRPICVPVSGPPSSVSRPTRSCGSIDSCGASGRPGAASPTPNTGVGSDSRSPDSRARRVSARAATSVATAWRNRTISATRRCGWSAAASRRPRGAHELLASRHPLLPALLDASRTWSSTSFL